MISERGNEHPPCIVICVPNIILIFKIKFKCKIFFPLLFSKNQNRSGKIFLRITDKTVLGLEWADGIFAPDSKSSSGSNLSTICKGVKVYDRLSKETYSIMAEKEVILCAGSVGDV